MTGATFNGLLVKTNPERGGFVEDVRFERVTAEHLEGAPVAIEASTYYAKPNPNEEIVRTRIRNISIKDVVANEAERTYSLKGDPDCPVEGVRIENVTVTHPLGKTNILENVTNLQVD